VLRRLRGKDGPQFLGPISQTPANHLSQQPLTSSAQNCAGLSRCRLGIAGRQPLSLYAVPSMSATGVSPGGSRRHARDNSRRGSCWIELLRPVRSAWPRAGAARRHKRPNASLGTNAVHLGRDYQSFVKKEDGELYGRSLYLSVWLARQPAKRQRITACPALPALSTRRVPLRIDHAQD
jgi:hypothetical protein